MKIFFKAFLGAVCLISAGSAAAWADDGIAVNGGTLWAGPGSDYPDIKQVDSGEGLHIYGCLNGYDWCDVEAGGDRGWFAGSNIAFVRDGHRVLLRDDAAALGIGIVTFALGDYWGHYYSNRPFYHDQNAWQRHGVAFPGGGANHDPHPAPAVANGHAPQHGTPGPQTLAHPAVHANTSKPAHVSHTSHASHPGTPTVHARTQHPHPAAAHHGAPEIIKPKP